MTASRDTSSFHVCRPVLSSFTVAARCCPKTIHQFQLEYGLKFSEVFFFSAIRSPTFCHEPANWESWFRSNHFFYPFHILSESIRAFNVQCTGCSNERDANRCWIELTHEICTKRSHVLEIEKDKTERENISFKKFHKKINGQRERRAHRYEAGDYVQAISPYIKLHHNYYLSVDRAISSFLSMVADWRVENSETVAAKKQRKTNGIFGTCFGWDGKCENKQNDHN